MKLLFSTPIVRAIRDGRKTMVRYVVKGQVPDGYYSIIGCPYTKTGWGLSRLGRCSCVSVKCPYEIGMLLLIGSIFGPLVTVTDVRVERLQEISDEDIAREGIDVTFHNGNIATGCVELPNGTVRHSTARHCFESRWDYARRHYQWKVNPWVWVISFERK